MNVYVSHCANHADEEGRLSGGGANARGTNVRIPSRYMNCGTEIS